MTISDFSISPASGEHAIEVMALAVEWTQPLDDNVIGEIESFYESSVDLKSSFPVVREIQGVSIQVENSGSAFNAARKRGFQMIQPGEGQSPAWALIVHPEFLTCNCMAYDRWSSVKPKALAFMESILRIATKTNFVQAVGVQYHDRFAADTQDAIEAMRRLFNSENRWLSPHVLEQAFPWSIKQSWFHGLEEGKLTHNLLAVDLKNVEGGSLSFEIGGQHRMLFQDSSVEKPRTVELPEISSSLDELHAINKAVLCELLDSDICVNIGLCEREGL
ncbi:MAG: TIGR04255 family protein [Xylophilus ampelinus]